MRRILIVEDDTVLGNVLHMAFRRELEVELATNAVEAMSVFQQAPPHVIMTDKNMPGMTGLELLREIRRLDPHVGMVVMTAYGTAESAGESFDLGVAAYIEKPFRDVIALAREMAVLADLVEQRRRAPRSVSGPMRIFAATSDVDRREVMRRLFPTGDSVQWFGSFADLKRAVQSGGCHAAVIDCAPLDVAAADAAIALDATRVPCVAIAEGLEVPEIARLIELSVKALVSAPLGGATFARALRESIERIRRG